jgi:peptidoglycan/xylan/chitin deacetylase (PgdA/CDA1 family)
MIAINYHEISAGVAFHRYAVSRRLFQAHIDALVDQGFSFVTLAGLLQPPADERPRQCAITFDDGRLGAYERGAGILREHGIKATFFICPDWLEEKPQIRAESYSDFMTWDHVTELAAEGHLIGSHGKGHLPFFEMASGPVAREISDSKRLIEQRLGTVCEHFASPWGQINRVVMNLVRDAGYKTLSSTVPGPNKIPYDLFRLRRLDSSHYPSLRRFRRGIGRHVDAHSRFDVALLTVEGAWKQYVAQVDAIAGFDLVLCLDDGAYALCMYLGLPCSKPSSRAQWSAEQARELLLSAHGEMARERTITFTPLTLTRRETHPAWTYLSSFLRATNRTR